MKRTTFSILFFIKRAKLLKTGEAPIYLRITVDGKCSELSLNRSVKPNMWDTPRNKVKGKSEEAEELNGYLTSARGLIFQHQQRMREDKKVLTHQALRNAFLGVGETHWTIVMMFEEHNANMESLVGVEYSPLTLQRFKTALKHVVDFCRIKYKVEDILISEINHEFITGIELYLKTKVSPCSHNTTMKHMRALKKIIRIALARDYIRKDPFVSYKIKVKKIDREILTTEEVKILLEKTFEMKTIEVVRDLFVFQCYTGLAYNELKNLSKNNLVVGVDKLKWIKTVRGKTGTECNIPLLPIAEQILDKYADHPCHEVDNRVLPVPANQPMNRYLKEIAVLCGIDKNLCTHMARHTFATTITLSNGIPLETVSKLLGHTKIQTTQIYAKVLDTKISEDMMKLRDKLS
jgi:site-specific recombinase XerD